MHPIENMSITSDQVEEKLKRLNPSKSAGPDKMHPQVLRELRQMAQLFQLSLKSEKLPSDWKVGNISPIHKKGSRQIPGNYRPVSLTSVVGKVMEQLIRDVITDHLVTNELLTACQHGFIKGRSCITQLLATLDHWTEVMDRDGDVDAIYLDFSKCFDSVPHERLLLKIQKYGIQGKLWSWIADFLRGRKQQVSIEGCQSILSMVLSGIPQGSVLGPLLFIIFVNEMPELVHSSILMFADDTKVFTEIRNEEDATKLQEDLTALQEWSQIWQLRFNPDKCHVLHLGSNNQKYKYNMNKSTDEQTTLQETLLEKDLGVLIDPTLTFSSHCEAQVGKANRILGMIRRTYSYLDNNSLVKLYTSLVRPRLEYGYPAWSPLYKKDCILLENVQRRATKMVPKLKDLPYEDRLKVLNLPSLFYRRARGDIIEIYKHISGSYSIEAPYIKLEVSPNENRGHKCKIQHPRTNRRVRKNFLLDRAANTWNRLPAKIVEAPSLNTLKNRLDKFWSQYRYGQSSPHDHYNYDRSYLDRPNLLTGSYA